VAQKDHCNTDGWMVLSLRSGDQLLIQLCLLLLHGVRVSSADMMPFSPTQQMWQLSVPMALDRADALRKAGPQVRKSDWHVFGTSF
jgi:hypothetical protein